MNSSGWRRIIVLIAAIIVIGLAGFYSFSAGRNFALTSPFEGIGGFSPISSGGSSEPEGGPTTAPGETPAAPSGSPEEGEEGQPQAEWEGAERITVLIMGLDYRDWEAGNDAPRTDTMILLTMDPVSRTAGMLSIPRDLWVNIPGFQPAFIVYDFLRGVRPLPVTEHYSRAAHQ